MIFDLKDDGILRAVMLFSAFSLSLTTVFVRKTHKANFDKLFKFYKVLIESFSAVLFELKRTFFDSTSFLFLFISRKLTYPIFNWH